MAKKYSPEKYRAKIEAGGLTRRQEINRVEYARALLDNPKLSWPDAQKKLDVSQQTIINEMVRMKEPAKEKQAAFHMNDWKATNRAWQDLAKKTPALKNKIETNKKKMQLKMVFGKEVLTNAQKIHINIFLGKLLTDGENFGTYWGY